MEQQNKQKFIMIYDEFRDLELNKEYYAVRMQKVRDRLRFIDIFLALFTAGSAVAGFSMWNYVIGGFHIGQILFGTLTGIAIVISIARPYLKLEDELERLSSIQGTYDSMAFQFKDIVHKVKTNRNVDEKAQIVYDVLRGVRGTLGAKEDKPPNRKLVDAMAEVINKRYPVSYFWYPE